jgi:endonuclease/exonuclease/phosphatase family metal-dependent hydrolase
MLEDYLRQQDIEIVLLQEVTHTKITLFRRYNAYVNVSTEIRGTAFLAKEGLPLTNTIRLPSGRGLAVSFEGLKIINIYALSGAEKRREREAFYNTEVPILLPSTPAEVLFAGDFNCVLSHADSTGQGNYSKMLEKLVRGFSLHDAYNTPTPRPNYTHFTPTGASRLDRIYITEHPRKNKHGVETMPAAFTDHLAVIIRLSLQSQSTRYCPSY